MIGADHTGAHKLPVIDKIIEAPSYRNMVSLRTRASELPMRFARSLVPDIKLDCYDVMAANWKCTSFAARGRKRTKEIKPIHSVYEVVGSDNPIGFRNCIWQPWISSQSELDMPNSNDIEYSIHNPIPKLAKEKKNRSPRVNGCNHSIWPRMEAQICTQRTSDKRILVQTQSSNVLTFNLMYMWFQSLSLQPSHKKMGAIGWKAFQKVAQYQSMLVWDQDAAVKEVKPCFPTQIYPWEGWTRNIWNGCRIEYRQRLITITR